VGGNFLTQKQYANFHSGSLHADTGYGPVFPDNWSYRYVYDGPISIQEVWENGLVSFPSYVNSSNASLDMFGATAIANCSPTKPTANLLASLAETYHEGLPKLVGLDSWEESVSRARRYRSDADRLRRDAKTGSSEWLNYQFGWLPLVSDVQDFVKSVAFMDLLLQQYIRDNGKVVRRRFVFPPETSVVESVVRSPTYPRLGVNSGQFFDFQRLPKGQVLRRRETTVRRWFSGAFVYHLPRTFFARLYEPYASEFQVYRKVLGLELTPDVLWELTPWSWAADWFSNAGDVIHNTSAWASGGLVMKYGYIMEHSVVRDRYTYVGPTNVLGGSTSRPPDVVLVSETKQRRKANPFGFGLTMGGLSSLQKSILVAVGLSRSR